MIEANREGGRVYLEENFIIFYNIFYHVKSIRCETLTQHGTTKSDGENDNFKAVTFFFSSKGEKLLIKKEPGQMR